MFMHAYMQQCTLTDTTLELTNNPGPTFTMLQVIRSVMLDPGLAGRWKVMWSLVHVVVNNMVEMSSCIRGDVWHILQTYREVQRTHGPQQNHPSNHFCVFNEWDAAVDYQSRSKVELSGLLISKIHVINKAHAFWFRFSVPNLDINLLWLKFSESSAAQS